MAGNNRTTVWNMDTARGFVQWLGGALVDPRHRVVAARVAQGAARLTAVEVLPMQGSTLQVRLRTDGAAPQPLTFTIDQPARLSVDLPDVGLALENRRIDVGAGGVDTIVAAEATGRTRVVFNLDSLVPYTAVAEGDSVLVTLGARRPPRRPPRSGAAACSRPPIGRARSITGVDFRRSPEGAGRVVVQLSDPVDARQPQAGRQPRDRRLHRRRARRRPHEALRRRRLRDARDDVRRDARRQQRAPRRHGERRLRAARLPDRQPVRGRGPPARRARRPRSRRRTRSTRASA